MGRDPKHDYRRRCIYHITITKARGCPDFSAVTGPLDRPVVKFSRLGQIIEAQILGLPELCPSLQVLQYVIMPDHLHFAIFAREYLPRVLGRYIGMMKVKCGQNIRAEFPHITDVFTEGFHDRYLRSGHSLSTIIDYIRANPFRLLVRKQNPDYFRKINNLPIDGELWQAYGNLQLLDNPFKAPVIVHRADTESLLAHKNRHWKHLAENGGVLVSAFISPAEKEVRRMCEDVDGKIILLTNKPFDERCKPGARDFDLCCRGRMLILAPLAELEAGRAAFMRLNGVAQKIAMQGAG